MSDDNERDSRKMKRKTGPDDLKAPGKKRQKIKDKNKEKSVAVKKSDALIGKADSTKNKVKLSNWSEDDKKNNSDGGKNTSEMKRNEKGQVVFKDHPEFTPNMTPKEVLQAGSFGGTYFRAIYSSVTKQHYKDVWQEIPKDWLDGLNISKQVASSTYRENVNTYNVKCGGSLEMWESSGWIVPQDPYGWFQWYCRFYQGRRTEDDARQISRWDKCAGVKGRWRQNLITKVVRSGCAYDNPSVSPVVRQTLQHWGYKLTLEDYKEGAKRVKPK
uniref:Zgc:113208 n=1 Tax=Sinocyclocheilus rhinocerous TaxID=307959 RepID=A0A673HST7_9TELE